MNTIAVVAVAAMIAYAGPFVEQPKDAAVESLLAEANNDTALVLTEALEDLEFEYDLYKIESEQKILYLEWQVDELTPSWWQKVLADIRLWFIFGAFVGAWAVGQ